MKTTFKSSEIAHIWAHKSAPRGTSPGAMSFHGDTFNSYGTAMARHITRNGKAAIILNETSYSVTTSAHQSHIRQALPPDVPVFKIGHIGQGCSLDFDGKEGAWLFDYAVEQAAHYSAKAERCRTAHQRDWHNASAASYLENAKEINAFFGLRRKVDEDSIERLRAARVRADKAKAKARAKREAAARAEQQEAFDAWLNGGERGYFSASMFPVAFRVEDDELVSTLGARVPLAAARVAYRFAIARKTQEWRRNGETCQVGNYQLDAINSAGIVAGCHRISWKVLERLAPVLAVECTEMAQC